VDSALHYHFDWAATLIELVGGQVPGIWDGQSFEQSFRSGKESGRSNLILSQGAWACQRSVRFNHEGQAYLCMKSYHGGHKKSEPLVLFNLTDDPHEQYDLSLSHPELVEQAMNTFFDWIEEQSQISQSGIDPMMTVLEEGGPFHTRGHLPPYLEHLRKNGRNRSADWLVAHYPDEL
jgi:arylsulfatase A-like enzyme